MSTEHVLADLEAQHGLDRRKIHCATNDSGNPPPESARVLHDRLDPQLEPDGAVVLELERDEGEAHHARWRNELWPWLHLVAIYRPQDGRLTCLTVEGKRKLDAPADGAKVWLVGRRREWVLSPDATVVKFDRNASAWNGDPGSPGYGHYRWMRRFVGLFGGAVPARRILDFGCGAGWVGIEAARRSPGASLAAFDPSPNMVELTRDNAKAEGIAEFDGDVGFGHAPPFPRAGSEPFDLVLSSGVVSFAPDFDEWMEGLVKTVAPGGTLIFGDINPASSGMQRRRRQRALLPVRELNGCPRERARQWLEARGFRHELSAGYQLTWPIPQAMYVSETKLKGLLSPLFLLANRMAAGVDSKLGARGLAAFDSWVMRFRRA